VAQQSATATPQGKLDCRELERVAARSVAAIAERIEIIWAPSRENERGLWRVHSNVSTRR